MTKIKCKCGCNQLIEVEILSKHRLLCGDSTNKNDVNKLMNGEKADLVFTSPPYLDARNYKNKIKNWDDLMIRSLDQMKKCCDNILINLGPMIKDGVWLDYWTNAFSEYIKRDTYVWDKKQGVPGENKYLAPAYEFIFHLVNRQPKINNWILKKGSLGESAMRDKNGIIRKTSSPWSKNKYRRPDNVIRIASTQTDKVSNAHPARFPVALCEYIYNTFSEKGEIILDPFIGSGTSLITCEQMSLSCRSLELVPEYCDMIIQRYVNLTGNKKLKRNGKQYIWK